ncbi:MAG: hypothetical protein FWC40_06770 [Proteobacteria bacterium]|nr:hypothetical protein [Pseudomonadota bacterium]
MERHQGDIKTLIAIDLLDIFDNLEKSLMRGVSQLVDGKEKTYSSQKKGLPILDKNGKVIGHKIGFREFSGWNEYDPQKDTEIIVETIINNCPEQPEPQYLEFIKEAMKLVILGGIERDQGVWVPKNKKFVIEARDACNASEIKAMPEEGLRDLVDNTKVYERCLKAHSLARPWETWEDMIEVTQGIHIHESYEGESWFSYNQSARTRIRYSICQFRSPAEEFGDVYTGYYASGRILADSQERLQWFIDNGLDPDKVPPPKDKRGTQKGKKGKRR